MALQSGQRGRYAIAAAGGLLLSVAFPSPGLAWAAWLAPGIILFSALGSTKPFRIGFVAGFAHFLSSIYWLIHMPFQWHGISLAPAAAWICLSAYCALYPALWVWLCWKWFPSSNVESFLAADRLRRMGWALAAGALWVALEYARGLLLTGFPWNFVGASQYRMTPLIQIAAFTGIYGVSFLVVWTSVSLGSAAMSLARQPGARGLWAEAGAPLFAVACAVSYGAAEMNPHPAPVTQLSVAMVQPSLPQTLIWDPAQDKVCFDKVLELSEKALASHPQLLLWPESAVPDLTPDLQVAIGDLMRRHDVWAVLCAGTAEPDPNGAVREYNSALLCNPNGVLANVYYKRRLVPFGEYVPLVRWFPFLKWVTSVGYNLSAGEHAVDFEMKNPDVKLSVLICFEDMFPQEARDHVGPETDFLVNLSNDGWFGHGAEQWQQAASAVFRAVENGVPILRCTNDGLTCWADAQGRMRQIFGAPGDVYGPGFMTAQIPLRRAGDRARTFYNEHGDWFPIGCLGLSFGWLAAGVLRRRASNLRADTVQK